MAGRPNSRKSAAGDGRKARRKRANQEQFAQARALVAAEKAASAPPPAETRRPYTPEDVEVVLEAMSHGQTLKGKCRELGVAESSVRMHLMSTPELERRYALARQSQAHAFAEQNLDDLDEADRINTKVDGAHVELGVIRHKFEVRKWTMGKYNAGSYGERVTQVIEGGDRPVEIVDRTLDPATAMARYLDSLKKLDGRGG